MLLFIYLFIYDMLAARVAHVEFNNKNLLSYNLTTNATKSPENG